MVLPGTLSALEFVICNGVSEFIGWALMVGSVKMQWRLWWLADVRHRHKCWLSLVSVLHARQLMVYPWFPWLIVVVAIAPLVVCPLWGMVGYFGQMVSPFRQHEFSDMVVTAFKGISKVYQAGYSKGSSSYSVKEGKVVREHIRSRVYLELAAKLEMQNKEMPCRHLPLFRSSQSLGKVTVVQKKDRKQHLGFTWFTRGAKGSHAVPGGIPKHIDPYPTSSNVDPPINPLPSPSFPVMAATTGFDTSAIRFAIDTIEIAITIMDFPTSVTIVTKHHLSLSLSLSLSLNGGGTMEGVGRGWEGWRRAEMVEARQWKERGRYVWVWIWVLA
ncbi:hypothetical protein Acr_20g0011480 [Actinidia rufa]|uniref:Uncharacterized protein n=1 Tax=Actinidia rufa TaxID=165716 RepID=A0A7J0GEV3_9ERIC|nr:hypothetical protein Acr_20g0011480 [Actinidia rufa]